MTQEETLRAVFRGTGAAAVAEPAPPGRRAARRARRAEMTRARVLSPGRILSSLATIPLVAAAATVTGIIRTSPYEPVDALRHVVALGGCEAAAIVGLPTAERGAIGYHPGNDPDGDGLACGAAAALPVTVAEAETPDAPPEAAPEIVTRAATDPFDAKFIRP